MGPRTSGVWGCSELTAQLVERLNILVSVWTLSAWAASLEENKTETCFISVESSKPFTSRMGESFFE